MRCYGNGYLMFAWDLGVTFLGVPNAPVSWGKKKNFKDFGSRGVMEICICCFLVYPF